MLLIWPLFIISISALALLFFHRLNWLHEKAQNPKKIKASPAKVSRTERRSTLFNVSLYGLVFFVLGLFYQGGYLRFYVVETWSLIEVMYLVLSFLLCVLLHDIYFYITHRFLHLPLVYRWVHHLHHNSTDTHVFSTFSFHPVEGLIQIGILPLLAFFVPLHLSVFFLFSAFMIFMSVYGHSGYEYRANKAKGLYIFNTSVHHHQHHSSFHYNFGIYLNLWDQLFKTNHPQYFEEVDQFKQRLEDSKSNF